MKKQYKCWALSRKFDRRFLLSQYCWNPSLPTSGGVDIAIFKTRRQAREARKTCCYGGIRAEKVVVTIETI